MQSFAVFIEDPESVEEFVGLARVNTEAEDAEQAMERAVRLHAEHTGRHFTPADVALCAVLAQTVGISLSSRGVRVF